MSELSTDKVVFQHDGALEEVDAEVHQIIKQEKGRQVSSVFVDRAMLAQMQCKPMSAYLTWFAGAWPRADSLRELYITSSYASSWVMHD